MDPKAIMKIFEDTAYIHTGGTAEELKAAKYIQSVAAGFGLESHLEAFDVDMATMHEAVLEIDGVSVPCKGYFNAGSSTVELKDDHAIKASYDEVKALLQKLSIPFTVGK